MSRKPIAHWTVEELKKIVTKKFEAGGETKARAEAPETLARGQALRKFARYQDRANP
jgi:hypothetical protein